MKKQSRDAIEFPANPFVALADFVIVVLLILIMAFVYQSISTNRLQERIAIEQLQKRLNADCQKSSTTDRDQELLHEAFEKKQIVCTYTDGDLQRFWFDSSLFYQAGKAPVANEDKWRVLAAFGKALSRYQGTQRDPATGLYNGLYKRIEVNGNADRSEGSDAQVWYNSLARAQEAAVILQDQSGIHPELILATGSGCWVRPKPMDHVTSKQSEALKNKRLEIVVVYAGQLAVKYAKQVKEGS
jgi:cell division protein FtsI/penicillin-binding protein 2